MRRSLLAILLLLTGFSARANFEFNEKVSEAYTSIIRLRLDQGQQLLRDEKFRHPGNRIVILYENYIDFLKAFISENEIAFLELKKRSTQRLKQLDESSSGEQSPWYLYAKAEIIVQEALLRVKFREHVTAANQMRKAWKLIERNEALYPTFVLNRKLSGFLHTVVGAVPKEYHWLVDLAGMEGTIPQGVEELNTLLRMLQGSELEPYREEIFFYLGNIRLSFYSGNDPDEGLLSQLDPYVFWSPLLRYSTVSIRMRAGRNDDALQLLTRHYPDTFTYAFPFLTYKRGLARLRKLDLGAESDFRAFLNQYKGMNYVRAAWQKLAWIQLLKGDPDGYRQVIQTCRTTGDQLVDEDKEAFSEALGGDPPNKLLLRARLLFDGGYYDEAQDVIAGKPIDSFPRYRDQLEVTYRLARILQRQGQEAKAIEYYETTLKNGSSARYYFAANSALSLGNLYEEKGDLQRALTYYQRCLALDHHEYQNSIDQKAQAGLDRIAEALEKQ
ncbi:MAG: tetratricopeptide repeat protein [Bacteroidota bacterium]|jgi:tetratricopeptide (TPR) repeat protein|nr:tetratricopeptide repeat protein [Bacteroidia bacterium]MBP6009650.1 tetratricopeptide repeat protein [Bacteroidia bacterium]MBP7270024.1 tetratricopeptide repeat protein [Bacteroidia bacterium]MBP7437176.1 tetratricopeptide repeat protein [Bacteroidia bacterium]MBP7772107.1 tetratricopeptide repeat protein [Bacteroidia bacterium]